MRLFAFRFSSRRLLTIFLALLTVFLIVIEFLSVSAEIVLIADNQSRVDFIKNLGLHPDEECIEEKQLIIPEKFNSVYSKYNELQREAGYDLSEHIGRCATIYKYRISDYDEETFVNLIILDNRVIGGDISTAAFDGFMLPLVAKND